MSELRYESGRLIAVYVDVGRRESDRSPKLLRANFDILEWASTSGSAVERYAVPLGFERVTAVDINDNLTNSDNREAVDVGQEFGFYQTAPHIIGSHEGDGGDSWFGIHAFGLL